MRLEPLLKPECVRLLEDCRDRSDLMERLAEIACSVDPSLSQDEVRRLLDEREREHPTSTSEGIAFPHAMLADIGETMLIAVLAKPGVSFGDDSSPPCDLIFCMLGPADRPFDHVRLLARLARIVQTSGAPKRLRDAKDAEALFEALVEEDRAHG